MMADCCLNDATWVVVETENGVTLAEIYFVCEDHKKKMFLETENPTVVQARKWVEDEP